MVEAPDSASTEMTGPVSDDDNSDSEEVVVLSTANSIDTLHASTQEYLGDFATIHMDNVMNFLRLLSGTCNDGNSALGYLLSILSPRTTIHSGYGVASSAGFCGESGVGKSKIGKEWAIMDSTRDYGDDGGSARTSRLNMTEHTDLALCTAVASSPAYEYENDI